MKTQRTRIWLLAAICIPASLTTFAETEPPVHRVLSELKENSEAKVKEFQYPYLTCQTGRAYSISASALKMKVREYFKKGQLPFRSHFSKAGNLFKTGAGFSFPPEVEIDEQRKAIENCSVSDCKMKLNRSEKMSMEKSSEKIKQYRAVVATRLANFLQDNSLLGYEDRATNVPTVGQMLGQLPYLAAVSPALVKFFSVDFWKKKRPPAGLKDSFLRMELLKMDSERFQPTVRIGEVFEWQESNHTFWIEVHVYTNHYFDTSLRIYELVEWGKGKNVLILSDIMEIDELTKSGFIRSLFQGKMESALFEFQNREFKAIE